MSATKPVQPRLPKHVAEVVTELQSRVWRLRSLIQCVREADHEQLEDYEAALSGLVDYADDIHLAMDVGTIAERAAEKVRQ